MIRLLLIFLCLNNNIFAQAKEKPQDTEIWSPEPKVVESGMTNNNPPADAIILFDGKNLDEWVLSKDINLQAKWVVSNDMLTVLKSEGNIQTKRSFKDVQLHIEWKIPEDISGKGQLRGNSGVFFSTGPKDNGYEIQIVDCYENPTYVNGQAGSIYKQSPPLVNVCKRPGNWQSYDIIWKAPIFNEDDSLKSPAFVTVFHNGVLIQNNFELKGETLWIGTPKYKKHGPTPIKLQAHPDPSEPISFRNIWIREL